MARPSPPPSPLTLALLATLATTAVAGERAAHGMSAGAAARAAAPQDLETPAAGQAGPTGEAAPAVPAGKAPAGAASVPAPASSSPAPAASSPAPAARGPARAAASVPAVPGPAGPGSPATPPSSGTPGPVVAVAIVRIGRTLSPQRPALESRLTDGLVAAGWRVIPASESRRKLRGGQAGDRCTTAACWSELADSLGAPLVARARVMGGRRYRIALELDDARSGRALARQALACRPRDPCLSVLRHMEELARELGRKGKQALALSDAASPAGDPAPAEAPALPSIAVARAPASDLPPRVDLASPAALPGRRSGGMAAVARWALLGSGAALLATGVALHVIDGRGTDCVPTDAPGPDPCLRLHDTQDDAYLAGAAGALLVGAGVTWWLLGTRSSAALALGPSRIGLRGRF